MAQKTIFTFMRNGQWIQKYGIRPIGVWFAVLLLFCGCSGGENRGQNRTQEHSLNGARIERTSTSKWADVEVVAVEPHYNNGGENGIRVKLKCLTKQQLADSTLRNFVAFKVNAHDEQGRWLELFDTPIAQAVAYSDRPSRHDVDLFLPYRLIPQPVGQQTITLSVNCELSLLDTLGGGVNAIQHYKAHPLQEVESQRKPVYTIHLRYQQPQVFHEHLLVQRIAMDTRNADPSQSDFHLPEYGGTGYPDLYWAAWLGNTYLGRGQRHRNCLDCTRPEELPAFHWAQGDRLRFKLMDRDVFSMDDELGEVSIRVDSLSTDPATPSVLSGGVVKAIVVYRLAHQQPS